MIRTIKLTVFSLYCLISLSLSGQINAGLFRFPDVSKDHIVFSYANDLWIVAKSGGTAQKLSSPVGVEGFAKFSPSGTEIAFTANYDGNPDIYLVSINGGIPDRLTYHGMADRVIDWHPDGSKILFASGRESEKERFNQFYTISKTGGNPSKLPLPYGEFASYSQDGKNLAMVFRSEVFRTWKRYRGGDVADIYLFNLENKQSENISSKIDAGEELPMWYKTKIYFLSDNTAEKRMNLWEYDLNTKQRTQLTFFKTHDVHFPSLGVGEIVFEAEGKLYLYEIAGKKLTEVKVSIVSDKISLKNTIESVDKLIQNIALSPDGNRALVEARGDIFSIPAENGFIKNLNASCGVAERSPSWSPDGKSIAYWSDETGEYELWLQSSEGKFPPKKISNYGPGFRYQMYWSPDSKKLAFIDKAMNIKILDVTTGVTINVDKGMRMSHGPLLGFKANWSSDSRWLAYHRDLDNYHNAVFIYDVEKKLVHQITSGYYECNNAVFDPEGKYLYLLTNQYFQPSYSDLDNTFIYANSTQLAAINLLRTTPSLLAVKNDTVEIKMTDTVSMDQPKDKKKTKNPSDTTSTKKPTKTPVEIDFEGIESRLILLPIKPGNYSNLSAVKGKIIYQKYPNTGAASNSKSATVYYDIEKREEKTILDDTEDYLLSANGSKLLVAKAGSYAIIKAEENQKFEKALRVNEMEMLVEPMKEWKQLLIDAWRLERDYFYDATMHGVDWEQVKQSYLKMLEGVTTREELNFVIGEMIAELNASHTYNGGGDEEQSLRKNVGYLGINWQTNGANYQIKNIIRAAAWDAEIRSPLDAPGLGIKEGDFILAINGIPLSTKLEPAAIMQGLAEKTIELTYNTTASWTNAKKIVVQTLRSESRLRHLAWIESNRKWVDDNSQGTVGYIYVRSTGVDGQNELIRQFNAQWQKKALIIDERFNNGGQIPDRFVELLNREPLAFFAIRDGETWPWPPYAHFGPKVMLINGWSGSGGDAFPDYFRKKKLGPLIGARTWGGLIGISGVPGLIDGGGITAPTFRMYNPDGSWFKEGHGVDPDIEVMEDLTALSNGTDSQLSRALLEVQNLLKSKEYKMPGRPEKEVR